MAEESQETPEKKTPEAPKPVQENAQTPEKTKRNRPLPFWIDAVDKVCAADPSLIGFLRSSRLYRGEGGNYTLRLDNEFGIQMLTVRKNVVEKLAEIISQNEGKTVAASNIVFDASNKMEDFDEAEDGLDEILGEVNE